MLSQETKQGKTPNGGVRSLVYYRDDNGNPVDKQDATQTEVMEYDDNNNVVGRTVGILGKSKESKK